MNTKIKLSSQNLLILRNALLKITDIDKSRLTKNLTKQTKYKFNEYDLTLDDTEIYHYHLTDSYSDKNKTEKYQNSVLILTGDNLMIMFDIKSYNYDTTTNNLIVIKKPDNISNKKIYDLIQAFFIINAYLISIPRVFRHFFNTYVANQKYFPN